MTALMCASENGNSKIVSMLLRNNADQTIKSNSGKKIAEQYALEGGHSGVAHILNLLKKKKILSYKHAGSILIDMRSLNFVFKIEILIIFLQKYLYIY